MPMKQKIQRQPRHRQERPEIVDCSSARCVALKSDGSRCNGPWQSAMPVVFRWDPRRGLGVNSLSIVLCVKHDRAFERLRERWRNREIKSTQERLPLAFGGWLGLHEPHLYYIVPFRSPKSEYAARFWVAHMKPFRSGESSREEAPR
jgi:hypothetical protein